MKIDKNAIFVAKAITNVDTEISICRNQIEYANDPDHKGSSNRMNFLENQLVRLEEIKKAFDILLS